MNRNMQAKVSARAKYFGIYVHVPFCAHRCSYCGFYQERPTKQALDNYVNSLIEEIEIQGHTPPADTIYWGGGTPTVLSPENTLTIGKYMHKNHPLLEWSVECSPRTVTLPKLRALKEIGVTRITMGVQSFNEQTMTTLGRRQQTQIVFQAYDMIHQCEFDNIGIDLIFAVPGQSLDQWLSDLKIAITMSPEHISTYNLTYEGDSRLSQLHSTGQLITQTEDTEIKFFTATDRFLTDNGYVHYEVSNFCKPGHESIHNSHTWEMQDWIGYGPSASSQFMNQRFTNIPSLKSWSEGVQKKRLNRYDFYELDDQVLVQDSLIFGLRMFKGIDLSELQTRFPHFDRLKYEKFFKKLSEAGLAQFDKGIVKLTISGILVVDRIGAEILQI